MINTVLIHPTMIVGEKKAKRATDARQIKKKTTEIMGAGNKRQPLNVLMNINILWNFADKEH